MKNFLRPTKARLIIFGLIFFLSIHLPTVARQSELEYLKIAEIILSPHYYVLLRFITPPPLEPAGIVIDPLLTILVFMGGFIYCYILSCLIIFIYEKLKGKLRKRIT